MKIDNIKVNTLDNKTIDLMAEFKGKSMLILFFNIKCLGCVGRAIPLAFEYAKNFPNLSVIGIHTSFTDEVITSTDILNIFTRKELPFPIYFDINKINYEQFKCEGTPHWVLIDKSGHVYRSFFGSQEGAQQRIFYALEEMMQINFDI